MVERVYLHIGAPKTGTTYLQQALGLSRRRLRRAGVLYPEGVSNAHHTSVWDLRGILEERGGVDHPRGQWSRTVERLLAWDGPTALLSSELFVYADKREAAKALGAFGDVDVHVIYTARDLVRQVPAVWQERLKNQRTMAYEHFVTDVIGPSKTGMAQGFWDAQDIPTALKRWSKGLPAERVHVVTMPPSGSSPTQLWDRFLSVLGLDSSQFVVDVPAVNTSMGAVEAEVLRRVNQRHGKDVSPAAYRKIVRLQLFDVLDDVVADKVKIVLTPEEHNALVARGQAMAKAVAKAGYDVVGDLDDLVPAPVPSDGPTSAARRPADIRPAEMVNALVDVVWALLEERSATADAQRGRRRRRQAVVGEDSSGTPDV